MCVMKGLLCCAEFRPAAGFRVNCGPHSSPRIRIQKHWHPGCQHTRSWFRFMMAGDNLRQIRVIDRSPGPAAISHISQVIISYLRDLDIPLMSWSCNLNLKISDLGPGIFDTVQVFYPRITKVIPGITLGEKIFQGHDRTWTSFQAQVVFQG